MCFACKCAFTLIRRKHHCRICKRVFCFDCSNNYAKPVSYLSLGSKSLRMCTACHKNQVEADRLEVFVLLLAAMPLSMKDKWKCRTINKDWNKAWMHFSEVRHIQYKTPFNPYTKLESLWMRTHSWEFYGHNRLFMAHALQCRRRRDLLLKHPQILSRAKYSGNIYRCKCLWGTKRRVSCRTLMCSSQCRAYFSDSDMVEMVTQNIYMDTGRCREVRPWMVPWFARAGIIVPSMYGLMEAQILDDGELVAKTQAVIPLQETQAWTKMRNLFAMIRKLVQYKDLAMREKIRKDLFDMYFVIEYPYSDTQLITDIDIENIIDVDSSSRPAIVPFHMHRGMTKFVLIKNDDVRNDRLAQVTLMLIGEIAGINVTTYNVIPTGKTTGWIELIPNCTTLYDIKYVRQTTIMDYIMEHNPEKTAAEIKARFVQSVAVSCVLSYILGLGDRHLENIMVSESGELLHIDFGYLFGEDPHMVPSEMRITRQTLEAMGGLNSNTFQEFGRQCEAIYGKVRKAAPLWYALFKHYGNEKAHKWVGERLIPGEFDTASATQIVDIVHKNSSTSILQHILDTTRVVRKSIVGLPQHFAT